MEGLLEGRAERDMRGPFFNNTGTAFDNSKKLIEGSSSRKGSFELWWEMHSKTLRALLC